MLMGFQLYRRASIQGSGVGGRQPTSGTRNWPKVDKITSPCFSVSVRLLLQKEGNMAQTSGKFPVVDCNPLRLPSDKLVDGCARLQ